MITIELKGEVEDIDDIIDGLERIAELLVYENTKGFKELTLEAWGLTAEIKEL